MTIRIIRSPFFLGLEMKRIVAFIDHAGIGSVEVFPKLVLGHVSDFFLRLSHII